MNFFKELKNRLTSSSKVDEVAYAKLKVVPRKWGYMPTLDRYILREFITKFSVLLLVFILGFIMGDVFDSLSDFLNNDATLAMTVSYFIMRLPGNIRFILPITMLLSCIWTMATFGKNHEITAMRASGVSLFRCGGSIFIIGILVSFVNIYFNEQLVPYSERMAITILADAKGEKNLSTEKMLIYRSQDGRRAWFFRVFDKKSINENVILKYYRPDGTLEYDINATKAKFVPGYGWFFTNNIKTKYSSDGLLPYRPEFIKEIYYPKVDVPEDPEDILNAIKDEEDLPSWVILDILNRSENMSDRMKNTYWTLFFYRLAFPWSCFLAVFLGIPLATKGERSGIMLAIITAVGVIIAYMITANIFLLLGKQGYIYPVIAGLAPTICFIIYGYYKVIFNQN